MLTSDDIYAIERAITALEDYEGYFMATASLGADGLQKLLDRFKETPTPQVEITVYGGSVQDVKLPPGIEAVVKDYDADALDPDAIKDAEGNPYTAQFWK